MKVQVKPRLQKDKWSLYWKTSMCTKTELLDALDLELPDAATVAQLKAAVCEALGWSPVGGLLRLEGFEEPWELWARAGVELPEAGSLAAAGVTDGATVTAVRKVLVAEGAWRARAGRGASARPARRRAE